MASSPRTTKIAHLLGSGLGELSFHVRYTDAKENETSRTITPVLLFQKNNRTGVYAYCHLREQMRCFYCDRIGALDPLPALKKFSHKELINLVVDLPNWLKKAFS